MRIRAAVTESEGAPFAIEELEAGELRPDEVLVEVKAAGICHTDLICRDQWMPVPLPAVLGHEGAGIVREVGAFVTKVALGDRVALTFNSCGSCSNCLKGRSTYCVDIFGRNFGAARPDGTSALSREGELVHGHFFGQSSFATHAVAHVRSVVKLPEGVDLGIAAPFGCGIQTGAGGVLNSLQAPAGSSIAVSCGAKSDPRYDGESTSARVLAASRAGSSAAGATLDRSRRSSNASGGSGPNRSISSAAKASTSSRSTSADRRR